MRPRFLVLLVLLLAAGSVAWQVARPGPPAPLAPLPYAEAGLTDREAAAHLLSRFTFGARPGDVDRVVEMGLEQWLDAQLRGDLPDRELAQRLRPLEALDLSAEALAATYPNPGRVLRQAARAQGRSLEELQQIPQRERREQVRAYMDAEGLKPQRELVGQLIGQKLLRAVYSENQLREVLTDFWFNHFNVSLQDNQARAYVLAYERDAIRPHVLGDFRTLLGATARHPAMLFYLDNAQSTAPDGTPTTVDAHTSRRGLGLRAGRIPPPGRRGRPAMSDSAMQDIPEEFRPRRGINENYARELLELHTLGVDGGYTQQDVEAVARAFTGWSVVPPTERADRIRRRVAGPGRRAGFAIDGLFLFRADAHDATEKTILGEAFPAGGGLDEGERVLDLVAAHPATARHLAEKIAARFVADAPPEALVETLAGVFLATGGDLQAVVRTLAYAPEFWDAAARTAKVKAPFELAVSAARALDADVRPTRALVEWIDRMGQPLYRYQAPTGFPDEAAHWISAGALLNRMNFGVALAAGHVEGVAVDLPALAGEPLPATVEDALAAYAPLLLPERAVDVAPLLPMAADPDLATKLDAAAPPAALSPPVRAVGVLLGAPDFQRR